MHRVLPIMAMLATGPALAGAPTPTHAAVASHPVFACYFKRGSVSVTVSGDRFTLRWKMPGQADATVTGTAGAGTVLYRQDRYAGPEGQLRFVSGRQSYIVYSMAGNRQTEVQPVSGLSVLRDRTLQSDLSCTPYAEFTAALSGFPLPEDSPDYAAMGLQ